jgi:Mlc titration factor MtfA (ptsG expression regulator)
MFGLFESRKRRRDRLRSEPFPDGWEGILRKNVPLYAQLPEEDQKVLRGHVQVFLDEKRFEGCGGLVINDEIRVTIAAQACLLQLRGDPDYYPRLITILVYPSAYSAHERHPIGGGAVLEGEVERLGEAWSDGVIVLSWDGVRAGGDDFRDGHNLVLHEFAHQLDQQDGAADGTPILESRGQYARWAQVLGSEYGRLKRNAWLGRSGVLDEYGATDPAEFFAVATESFFERPTELRRKHPELYQELLNYYRIDTSRISQDRNG